MKRWDTSCSRIGKQYDESLMFRAICFGQNFKNTGIPETRTLLVYFKFIFWRKNWEFGGFIFNLYSFINMQNCTIIIGRGFSSPGGLPIMDYKGMLRPKGIPFWTLGMGKGSLFRERYVTRVPLQGKVCVMDRLPERVPIFQNLVCKRVPIFQNWVCKRVPIFQNLVCERVRGPDRGRSIHVWNRSGFSRLGTGY